jgi:hypothetical protein
MRAKRTIVPVQQGTNNLLRQDGSQLVRVRYRYDEERRSRFSTVALDHGTSPPSIAVHARIICRTLVGFAQVEEKWECNDRSNKLEAGGIL